MGLEKLETPAESKIRQALYALKNAEFQIKSSIDEARVQEYLAEAAALQLALDDLIAARVALEIAIAS